MPARSPEKQAKAERVYEYLQANPHVKIKDACAIENLPDSYYSSWKSRPSVKKKHKKAHAKSYQKREPLPKIPSHVAEFTAPTPPPAQTNVPAGFAVIVPIDSLSSLFGGRK
jgi:hypothetical protein